MRIRLSIIASIAIISGFCLFAENPAYSVRKGDTLYGIARKFGISISALMQANGIKENEILIEGRKLVIPSSASATPRASESPKPASSPSPAASPVPASPTPDPAKRKPTGEYVIKPGDTLFGIARAHGMEIEELLDLNRIKKNAVIKTGKKLLVYLSPPKASPKTDQGKRVDSGLSWPVAGKMEYLDGKLFGVSITGKKGDPIRAVANGTVIQANTFRGYSGVIFIERADKMIYVYGGTEGILVKKGDKVQAGMKLGFLALDPITSQATMPFLVFQNGKALDPSLCPRD